MSLFPPGTCGESHLLVTTDVAVSFLGLEDARVLGTPWMILHMEITSRNTVKPFLLDGQDTVGTEVNVRHLAATPLGSHVRFTAEKNGVWRHDGKSFTNLITKDGLANNSVFCIVEDAAGSV